jgi:hypothetical protein
LSASVDCVSEAGAAVTETSVIGSTAGVGGPRADSLISAPVASELAADATVLAEAIAISADAVPASGVGVSVVPEALVPIEICAWSGACCVTAEPSWLPLDSAATSGASEVAEEIVRDPLAASVGAVASGAAGVSMSAATGVTVAVRSGADPWIVVSLPGVSLALAAIDAEWLALNERRGCIATVAAAAGADVQPSSPVVDVVESVDGAVELLSPVGAGVEAGAADGEPLAAPGMDGRVGSVPIESSYVGRFAVSCFGWRGAGRVTYSLVTTGIG